MPCRLRLAHVIIGVIFSHTGNSKRCLYVCYSVKLWLAACYSVAQLIGWYCKIQNRHLYTLTAFIRHNDVVNENLCPYCCKNCCSCEKRLQCLWEITALFEATVIVREGINISQLECILSLLSLFRVALKWWDMLSSYCNIGTAQANSMTVRFCGRIRQPKMFKTYIALPILFDTLPSPIIFSMLKRVWHLSRIFHEDPLSS